MRQLAIKALTLILLLICTAWLARDPGWDSLTGFLGTLIAYLGVEVKLSPRGKEHDARLFAALLEELPSEGETIYFLANHDMGASFLQRRVEPLDQFVERWQDAEHEFADKQLDKLRLKLIESIEKFMNKLNVNVYTCGSGWLSIGMRDWDDRPEMFELRQELDELATEVFKVHQELVRKARRKLPPV